MPRQRITAIELDLRLTSERKNGVTELRQPGCLSGTLTAAAGRHGGVVQQYGLNQLWEVILVAAVEHGLAGVDTSRHHPALSKPRVDERVDAVVDLGLLAERRRTRHQIIYVPELGGL